MRAMDDTTRYLRVTWLTWVKLLVVYNIVLLVEGLTCLYFLWQLGEVVGHRCAALLHPWGIINRLAITANLFYLFGPLAETYAFLLLRRGIGRGRYLLFAVGLSLSVSVLIALAWRLWIHIAGWL